MKINFIVDAFFISNHLGPMNFVLSFDNLKFNFYVFEMTLDEEMTWTILEAIFNFVVDYFSVKII
jgi:hypothetical protein